MRRKLTTLRAKQGGAQNGNGNGNPRQLIDDALYREHRAAITVGVQQRYDSEYSGWSHGGRPRDQAISLRSIGQQPRPPGPG
jgi:hypothetical protein